MFIDDKDKENDAWKFLFREMSVVYWTVDKLCDIEHETKDEFPDNFLIEFCVQWFLSGGGGDPIFGCASISLLLSWSQIKEGYEARGKPLSNRAQPR